MTANKSFKSELLLILAAFIWGTTFVAQRSGMEYVGAFTFVASRNLLACLFLIPVIIISDRINKRKITFFGTSDPSSRKTLLIGGVLCGVILFAAMSLQQFGLVTTSAGKSGFITTLYIVLVPVFGLVIGKKSGFIVWISVALSLAGLYLLCIKESLTLQSGDLLVMACAVVYAVHILLVDRFAPSVDAIRLSFAQFFVAFLLSTACAFIFEQPNFAAIIQCWLPIAYAGVLSSGVAFTLQIVAQKHISPAVAGLTMCLESVFALVGGAIVLHERLSVPEIIGCSLMLAAVVLCQIPFKKNKADEIN